MACKNLRGHIQRGAADRLQTPLAIPELPGKAKILGQAASQARKAKRRSRPHCGLDEPFRISGLGCLVGWTLLVFQLWSPAHRESVHRIGAHAPSQNGTLEPEAQAPSKGSTRMIKTSWTLPKSPLRSSHEDGGHIRAPKSSGTRLEDFLRGLSAPRLYVTMRKWQFGSQGEAFPIRENVLVVRHLFQTNIRGVFRIY